MAVKTGNNLGGQGENLAVEYLRQEGYEILERNYRYLKAELDIVARKGDFLVVVEVKTRTGEFLSPLADTISKKKISLLVSAAHQYVTTKNLDCEVRFDILAIRLQKGIPQIEHLKDAFYHF